MRLKTIVIIPLLLFLAACSSLPALSGQSAPTPTPTDCGCSFEGPSKQTPEPSGILSNPAGPGLSGGGGEAQAESLESYRDQWSTFSSPEIPFSFEYPAAYDSPSMKFCAARVDDFPPEGVDLALNLGSRTVLSAAMASTGMDPSAAADAFRADPAHTGYTFDPVQERTIAGLPALTLPYRSEGTNRYAEVTLFLRDGVLYKVETGSPSACDIPDLGLTEMNAYARMLESFRFVE